MGYTLFLNWLESDFDSFSSVYLAYKRRLGRFFKPSISLSSSFANTFDYFHQRLKLSSFIYPVERLMLTCGASFAYDTESTYKVGTSLGIWFDLKHGFSVSTYVLYDNELNGGDVSLDVSQNLYLTISSRMDISFSALFSRQRISYETAVFTGGYSGNSIGFSSGFSLYL